jgi:hypothetical protein
MERLESAWGDRPVAHLPRLAVDRGPGLVASMATCLGRRLDAASGTGGPA